MKVVVVGGGWSGCAAALAAKKAGGDVVLLERTDLLLGTGLVGGIFRNNGRYTAAQEAIEMGGGDLFDIMDEVSRHKSLNFPGHNHASLYDVNKIEPYVRTLLERNGIEVNLMNRMVRVKKYAKTILAIITDKENEFAGDVFIDATGTAGPMGNCLKYGNGCCMCVLRCPSFGPRISLTAKMDIKETMGQRDDGTPGAMSGACKLNKATLSPQILEKLERDGVVVVPLPEKIDKSSVLGKKACTQYALADYARNIILLDTGHAKLMTPYFSLNDLRNIPGFENVRYEDPYSGGNGNSIRYLGIAPSDDSLKVLGADNLFCCGEKAGLLVGHTEAIISGLLAGHNAVRHVLDMQYLQLPTKLACGDFLEYMHGQMIKPNGLKVRYSFSGSTYFERMKQLGLYTTHNEEIKSRVAACNLSNIYSTCLV